MTAMTGHGRLSKDISVRHFLKPFSHLISAAEVTEICVNRPGQIYVEADGGWTLHDAPDVTMKSLMALGVAIATLNESDFSPNCPFLSAVLPDGERIQMVCPPACEPDTLSVTIRKPSMQVRTLASYEASGFFSHVRKISSDLTPVETLLLGLREKGDYASFLRAAVKANLNVVVAGETGSGKTTLMKALIQEIPTHQRLITIEDVHELHLPNHDNHVHLFYMAEGGAGAGKAVSTSASLLRSCMRMKPDRILLAELRGAETFDFISVCASGHGGSITSCHAGSAELTFERLALMVMANEQGRTLPYEVIRKLLYLVVDVVVHVHNSGDGLGRHITELWYDPRAKRAEATAAPAAVAADAGAVELLKRVSTQVGEIHDVVHCLGLSELETFAAHAERPRRAGGAG